MTFSQVMAQNGVGTFELSDCWFDEVSGQDPACGWLTVPEDHTNPNNGRTLRLAVAVFPATGDNPAPDPLIYLDGGPGGSPLELVNLAFNLLFGAFVEQRDVILFDQRGVGFSEPALDCGEVNDLTLETLDDDLSTEEVTPMLLDAYQACYDRLTGEGIDLDAYNSAQSAGDVAMLREALGYAEVNLYGISYGTRLALTVMRDHPEGVRSVIIDSVYPPQVTLFSAAQNFYRALQTLFAGCAGDAACSATYPDLETVFYDTYAALNENPAEFEVTDINTLSTLSVVMNGDSFVGNIFQALYSAELIPSLPKAIYDASNGDYAFFATLTTLSLLQIDVLSGGMYYAVECAEEVPFTTPQELTALNANLPDALQALGESSSFGRATFALCDLWNVTPAPAIENEAVISDLPTLVMSGEYDPITPPEWGEIAASTLANSIYFPVPAVGHGAILASECATDIALAFLDKPNAAPDGSCLDDAPWVDFVIPGEALTLVAFSNEDLGISSVVPEGWTESTQDVGGLTVLTYSRGSDTALAFLVTTLPAESLLQGVAMQAGGELPEPQTLEVDSGTWSIYQVEIIGQGAAIAVAEIDGLTYLLQLLAAPNEIDDLVEQALIPAIEAFVVLE
jgi:pimeloyl-ACP methyl ester carboxylesterase